MTPPLLSLRNVESYYGPIAAVRGVSLDVARGQVVAVLGANGAGKTSLLRTISGVLDPRKGQVLFEGRPIHARDPDWIARLGISHVPEGREVFPFLSVRENLEVGAFARRSHAGADDDMALVFDYFPRLWERRNQQARLLSGGEQQMLAIGRALMGRPDLILLDEPSLGLSPKLLTEVYGIIRRLNEERGATILIVEQSAAAALGVAHVGYVMEMGRVVMEGAAADLLGQADIQEFYLGRKDVGARGERRWKRRRTWR